MVISGSVYLNPTSCIIRSSTRIPGAQTKQMRSSTSGSWFIFTWNTLQENQRLATYFNTQSCFNLGQKATKKRRKRSCSLAPPVGCITYILAATCEQILLKAAQGVNKLLYTSPAACRAGRTSWYSRWWVLFLSNARKTSCGDKWSN